MNGLGREKTLKIGQKNSPIVFKLMSIYINFMAADSIFHI